MNKGVVTAFLGIVVTDQWKVLDTSGGKDEHFGTLRCMAGHLLHATCTRHARCKLILSCPKRFFDSEVDLLKWLCCGVSIASQEEHYAASADMRAEFNTVK